MAGETILIVDDRADNIEFMREYILEPNGYNVIVARDGEEGLKKALSEKPDVMVSDLVMPKMGGLDLLEALRDKGVDLPAIMMTFHGSEETAVRAFRLGAKDYIIKPFTVEEMLNAIDNALVEARLRKERDALTQNIVRTNRELEKRVKELRTLYSIGRSVTSLLDQEQVLKRIVEAAAYLTAAEESSLMLVDEAKNQLVVRAARGDTPATPVGTSISIDTTIAGRVVRSGRPVMIGGQKEGETYKIKTGYFVKSMLNVPLKVGEKVVGVLEVGNRTHLRPFSEQHLNLLSALADYASIAIENARLYNELAASLRVLAARGETLEAEVLERDAALVQKQEQLERSRRLASLGHLATGVVQEMNSPLGNILEQVYALRNRLAQNDNTAQQALDLVEAESQRCQLTMKNLLDFAGQVPLQTAPVDINMLIDELVNTISLEAASGESGQPYKVDITNGLDPNLPLVPADEGQLKTALSHLLRYGFRSAGPNGNLRLITRRVKQKAQVIVSDSGEGLPYEQLNRIFDPFYANPGTGQKGGLGLSTAHNVIERHGGTIDVESQPGQGTTFTIHLPLEAARNVADE